MIATKLSKPLRQLFQKANVVPVYADINGGKCRVRTADGRTLKLGVNPPTTPALIAYVRKGNQPNASV